MPRKRFWMIKDKLFDKTVVAISQDSGGDPIYQTDDGNVWTDYYAQGAPEGEGRDIRDVVVESTLVPMFPDGTRVKIKATNEISQVVDDDAGGLEGVRLYKLANGAEYLESDLEEYTVPELAPEQLMLAVAEAARMILSMARDASIGKQITLEFECRGYPDHGEMEAKVSVGIDYGNTATGSNWLTCAEQSIYRYRWNELNKPLALPRSR